jgi:anti-anti-sigma factor
MSADLTIIKRDHSPLTILDLKGEVDASTVFYFRKFVLDALYEGVDGLILNLKEVDYLDSTGLGVMIEAARFLRPKGGALCLIEVPRKIETILTITRLNTVFSVFETEKDALKSLERPLGARPRKCPESGQSQGLRHK